MILKNIKILIILLLISCQSDLSKNKSGDLQKQNKLISSEKINIIIDTISTNTTLDSNSSLQLTNKTEKEAIIIDTNFTIEDFEFLYDEIKELGFLKFNDIDKEIYSEPKYKVIEKMLKRFEYKTIIKKDSLCDLLLNRAQFYGLKEVTDLLFEYQLVFEKVDTALTELIINKDDFKNLACRLRISIYGKVLSKSFDLIAFDDRIDEIKVPDGLHLFSGSDYRRNQFSIGNDTVMLIMSDNGFEMSSHIITVWKEFNNKIKLISILDHFFVVGIGGIYIEELITLNSTKKIIIGRESGADGDQMWGSLWLFVWEYPRSLRRIYEIDYDSESPIYRQIVDYSVDYDSMQLYVTKTHYNLKETDYDSEITDSIVTRKCIIIDSIIDFDIYESIYR